MKINITNDVANGVTFSDQRPAILRELNKGLSVEFHSAAHTRINWHGNAIKEVSTVTTAPYNELVKSKVKIIAERKHPTMNHTIVTYVCKTVIAATLQSIESMYSAEFDLQNGLAQVKIDRYAELKKQRDAIDAELLEMNEELRASETNPVAFEHKLSDRVNTSMGTDEWQNRKNKLAANRVAAQEAAEQVAEQQVAANEVTQESFDAVAV